MPVLGDGFDSKDDLACKGAGTDENCEACGISKEVAWTGLPDNNHSSLL